MANHFEFRVNVSCERIEGKFASRDDLAAQIYEALESANPGSFQGENGGEYEASDWTVEEIPPVKPIRQPRRKEPNELPPKRRRIGGRLR